MVLPVLSSQHTRHSFSALTSTSFLSILSLRLSHPRRCIYGSYPRRHANIPQSEESYGEREAPRSPFSHYYEGFMSGSVTFFSDSPSFPLPIRKTMSGDLVHVSETLFMEARHISARWPRRRPDSSTSGGQLLFYGNPSYFHPFHLGSG